MVKFTCVCVCVCVYKHRECSVGGGFVENLVNGKKMKDPHAKLTNKSCFCCAFPCISNKLQFELKSGDKNMCNQRRIALTQ